MLAGDAKKRRCCSSFRLWVDKALYASGLERQGVHEFGAQGVCRQTAHKREAVEYDRPRKLNTVLAVRTSNSSSCAEASAILNPKP